MMTAALVTMTLIAGLGWGALFVVVYLNPERSALRQEQLVATTIRDMQAVHDNAVQAITTADYQAIPAVSGGRHRQPVDYMVRNSYKVAG